MHKDTLATLTTLLATCLLACLPFRSVAGPLVATAIPSAGQVVPIAVGPEVDRHPALALGAGGQAHLAWLRQEADTGEAILMQARAPLWDTSSLIPSPRVGLALSGLAATSGEQPHLAWTGTTTQTAVIGSLILPGDAITEGSAVVSSPSLAVAADHDGGLHAAWADQGGIAYVGPGKNRSVTVSLEPGVSVDRLDLVVQNPREAHLAWAGTNRSGQTSGIWYARVAEASGVLTDTVPQLISDRGDTPVLAVGEQGTVFLTWRQDDTLISARSDNWGEPRAVATGLEADAVYDAAVGSDGTLHVVWAQNGSLWHVTSLSWSTPLAAVTVSGQIAELVLVVDRSGHPHVAWEALSEDNSGDILYAQLSGVSPQLAIRVPSEGQVLEDAAEIRVETNLAMGMLDRVEFYLQREPGRYERQRPGLVYIGVDPDGTDGWGVEIPVADLIPSRRYRVVALGTDVGGNLLHATGGWFQAQPYAAPDLWVQPVGRGVVSGVDALAILLRGGDRFLGPVDLFLAPSHCSSDQLDCDRNGKPPLEDAYYLGNCEIGREASAQPQSFVFDSRLVPDGVYRAIAVAQDSEAGTRYTSLPSQEIVVDNSLPPVVEVTAPNEQALAEGRIEIEATASDPDGSVVRVDFVAEREHPLLVAPDEALTMPFRVWLGSDGDGADGWSLSRRQAAAWSGGGWRAVAVASDDRGLSSEARSAMAFAFQSERATRIRVASPQPGSRVVGRVRVMIHTESTSDAIEGIDLYLGRPSGELLSLGPMQSIGQAWLYAWDTTEEEPGDCYLLYIVRQGQGREVTGIVDSLVVGSPDEGYFFSAPQQGDVLRGAALVQVGSLGAASEIERVSLFYRDAQGQLHPISQAQLGEGGWVATWHTRGALDGDYALVAELQDTLGATSQIEQDVRVENQTPLVALVDWEAGMPLKGDQPVKWQVEHPLGAPLSVTVLYSPDAGAHWMTLAEAIPATESYVWDTTRSPDTRQGLLRLSVTDGLHQASVTTPLLAVNNANQSPVLTILAPQEGTSPRELRIAWRAWDPDGDALTVKIDYQRDGGSWLRLATDLAPNESFLWEDPPPPTAGPYALRVTAIDALGAEGSDSVADVGIAQGQPPSVTLLWPSGGAALRGDAIILWHADDQDGDPLAIDLYYSENSGQAWLPLAEGLPNTGYFGWQLGYLPTGDQYRVRVVALDGQFSAIDESAGTFSVGECSQRLVALTTPYSGQTISGLVRVAWKELMYNPASQVNLELRSLGSDGWQSLMSGNNDGSYLWDTTLLDDGRYDLRVTLTEGMCSAADVTRESLVVSNHTNARPQIELLSPVGGETWQGLHTIAWDAWDPDGDPITLTLSISPDGGKSWEQIGRPNAGAGKHIWDTWPYPAGPYLVRARVTDGQALASDVSDGSVNLTHRRSHPPDVRLLSPNAQGALVRGDTLAWAAEDLDGDQIRVDVALSDDGGLSWRSLAYRRDAVGEVSLGDELAWERSYLARVVASDGVYAAEHVSPAFRRSIPSDQRPQLEITRPQKGDSLSGEYTIQWRADAPSLQRWSISISASGDGGLTWQSIASDLQGLDTWDWDTTQVLSGVYRLAVIADNGRFQTRSESAPFTVSNPGHFMPQVSLVLPRGPQVWSGLEEIVWRATPVEGDQDTPSARVWLEYSVDRGRAWRLLSSDAGQSGFYTWDSSLAPNSDEFWLRATTSQAGRLMRTIHSGPIAIRNPLAPSLRLMVPREGASWQGRQVIAWRATRPMAAPLEVRLEYSLDWGERWQLLARDLPAEGRYILDTATLPAQSDLLLRGTASDGRQTGMDTIWEPFHVEEGATAMEVPYYPR